MYILVLGKYPPRENPLKKNLPRENSEQILFKLIYFAVRK